MTTNAITADSPPIGQTASGLDILAFTSETRPDGLRVEVLYRYGDRVLKVRGRINDDQSVLSALIKGNDVMDIMDIHPVNTGLITAGVYWTRVCNADACELATWHTEAAIIAAAHTLAAEAATILTAAGIVA